MSLNVSSTHLSLQDIQKVTSALGNLAESTLSEHSLALIISKTGEATFTRCGWKVLSEAGCSSPVAKLIINATKNYTASCGEDCKYLLFVLNEMMNTISKDNGVGEAFVRTKLIHEISSMKQILPCLFKSILNSREIRVTLSSSYSFLDDLHSVVQAFMLSKFSSNVSKQLGSLICDFIQGICFEGCSLQVILKHVVSHFNDFCTKVLSLSESQVLKGFVFCKRHATSSLELENAKFIIVWDLSMKTLNDVTLKICNEMFIEKLNHNHIYHKLFSYFKKEGVKLLLTPGAGDKDVKLLCNKNDIILLDRLDLEEIQHILSCTMLSPLDNLMEAMEPKHIGQFKCLKSFYFNNSCFFNLECSNTKRLLNAHHILLSAPIDTLWKEYYTECLNCLKMVQQWLFPNSSLCSMKCHSTVQKSINVDPLESACGNMICRSTVQKSINVDPLESACGNICHSTVQKSINVDPLESACRNMNCYVCAQLQIDVNTSLKMNKSTISEVTGSNQNIQSDSTVNHKANALSHYSTSKKTNADACSQLHLNFDDSLKINGTQFSDVLELSQKDAPSDAVAVETDNKPSQQPQVCKKFNFNLCPQLKFDFEISSKISKTLLSDTGLHHDIGISLPPVTWEFLFLTSLERILGDPSLPCKNLLQNLHLTITKLICKKIGVSLPSVKNLQNACTKFIQKSKKDKNILEPIVCKEILIFTVLDLMSQLLKIDGIITIK